MEDHTMTGVAEVLLRADDGQTMAEYALVLAVITIVTVAVFTSLSDGVQQSIGKVIALFP